MGNLAEFHDQLNLQEKDFMVKVWNLRYSNEISIALLPFVDAWRMKTVMFDFYYDLEDDNTIIIPKVSFQTMIQCEVKIKNVLYLATRKTKRDKPS